MLDLPLDPDDLPPDPFAEPEEDCEIDGRCFAGDNDSVDPPFLAAILGTEPIGHGDCDGLAPDEEDVSTNEDDLDDWIQLTVGLTP